MNRRSGLYALLLGLGFGGLARAAEPPPLISPTHQLAADAPAWRDLVQKFSQQPDTTADFEERRVFPFRKEPVVLKGEVRVSRARGLSLHYTAPEERTMVFDDRGMVVRDPAGQKSPPPDPRANVANEALLLVLRLDFAALAKGFELYGRREGDVWSLGLVPRDPAVKKAIGDIHVGGDGATVRRIELRRSARQHIDILIEAPRSTAAFSAEELQRFFR
jgi:hypothetical protein